MSQEDTDRAMRQLGLRIRAALLADLAGRESALDDLYGKELQRILRRLRSEASETTIQWAADRIRKLTDEVFPIIEEGIRSGIVKGSETAQEQYEATFRDADIGPSPEFMTDAERIELASAQLRGERFLGDWEVPVSDRIWNNHDQVALEMAQEIARSVEAGDTIERTADRILGYRDNYWIDNPPAVMMPKYIREMRDAAKLAVATGDKNLLLDAVKKYERQISRQGSVAGDLFSVRPATRQLIEELKRSALPGQIEYAVNRWMIDRARHQAKVVARTETIAGYRQGYYESLYGEEWCKGIRWTLSPTHPKPDICDVIAGQDFYGLGPGGYPMGQAPDHPHPNCLCLQTAIIDDRHFERQRKIEAGERPPPEDWKSGKIQTHEEWLSKQPKEIQYAILGPTRLTAFEQGVPVFDSNVKLLKVRQLPDRILAQKKRGRPEPPPPPPPLSARPRPGTYLQSKASYPGELMQPRSAREERHWDHEYKKHSEYAYSEGAQPVPWHSDLDAAEQEIRLFRNEHALYFNRFGDLLTAETSGEPDRIVSHPAFMRSIVGVHTMTHNHPDERSRYRVLSIPDIGWSMRVKLGGELRAITRNGRGSSMKITDPELWFSKLGGTPDQGQTPVERINEIMDPILDAYDDAEIEAIEVAEDRFVDSDFGAYGYLDPRQDRVFDDPEETRLWNEAVDLYWDTYATVVHERMNEIGRDYGFEFTLF